MVYRQCYLVVAWLVPRETAAVSAQVLCTLSVKPCCNLQCRFIQSLIGRVHVCLAVTCHLHFWQNDRDLLRATAVTQDGTDTTQEVDHEKNISRRSRPFDHESGAQTTELSPILRIHVLFRIYTDLGPSSEPCFFGGGFHRETDSSCG